MIDERAIIDITTRRGAAQEEHVRKSKKNKRGSQSVKGGRLEEWVWEWVTVKSWGVGGSEASRLREGEEGSRRGGGANGD